MKNKYISTLIVLLIIVGGVYIYRSSVGNVSISKNQTLQTKRSAFTDTTYTNSKYGFQINYNHSDAFYFYTKAYGVEKSDDPSTAGSIDINSNEGEARIAIVETKDKSLVAPTSQEACTGSVKCHVYTVMSSKKITVAGVEAIDVIDDVEATVTRTVTFIKPYKPTDTVFYRISMSEDGSNEASTYPVLDRLISSFKFVSTN